MLPQSPINILVVGAGGREHALCWKLAKSQLVRQIYCAPGNGGTARLDKTENLPIAVDAFDQLAQFCGANNIELVVVGPDNPLADGIVDYLEGKGLRVFGPTKEAARLEWSKAFAKEFMQSIGLPTARFHTCTSYSEGQRLVEANSWAQVVKVDGLALGKGVFVCDSEAEVLAALKEIFDNKRFGESGSKVVLEERLDGEELSLLTLCDGKRLVPMPALQDHKRRFNGDKGPNTGGMGAYSPVELYDRSHESIEEQVLAPLNRALAEGRLRYKGVLYIGLMVSGSPTVSKTGAAVTPYVLEFNARFGDPETQALLPRLNSDLLPALWSCTDGTLDQVKLEWSELSSCCVVAVTENYPEQSSKGEPIELQPVPPDAVLFQAGTTLLDGKLQTAGGRILSVTGLAASMEAASRSAYAALKSVSFPSMAYRTDIAWRASKQCLSG
jgi:phosphoribosylamine--glycine ligase